MADTKLSVKDSTGATQYVDNESVTTGAGSGLLRQRVTTPDSDALLTAIAADLAGVLSVTDTTVETRWEAIRALLAASLPLPTGAATSAKQPALGTAGTASADVLTIQGVTSMTALKVDNSAVTQPVSGTFWQTTQPVSAASLPLPSGAATAANQVTEITNLASIVSALSSVAVTGTFWQGTQPVSGTVTANAGTNLNTSLLALEGGGNLAAIKADVDKIPSQGQALAAASLPVVLTAAQVTTLTPPVAISGFALEAGHIATVDTSTAAVSTATGATSDAAVTAGATGSLSAKLRSISRDLIANIVLAAGANVIGGVTQSGTWNVTNVSGTVSLPTGASTSAKQPAIGTAGSASADVITVQGVASMTAIKVSSVSAPVVTQNAIGNVVAAATSIAASATSTAVTVDATAKIEVQLQVDCLTGGTAQAAGTATVKIYRQFGAGPTSDTVPVYQFAISMGTASTHYIQSIALGCAKWSITVTNGDTANAITFGITSTTLDSIS